MVVRAAAGHGVGKTWRLTGRRMAAFAIDYVVVLLYVCILAVISLSVLRASGSDPGAVSPWRGQALGLGTLTLPVLAYFYLFERGPWRGTPGKRAVGLAVCQAGDRPARLLLRSVLKFLPWEIAHTGVHWLVAFESRGEQAPAWVLTCLVGAQVIVLVYLASLVAGRGEQALYDWLAGTRVARIR